MAGAGPDGRTCAVVVLAPRAGGTDVLVEPAGAGPFELPTVTTAAEPDAGQILAAVRARLGVPVVLLRANAVRWDESFDATTLLAELEPLNADGPPGALAWAGLDAATVPSVGPADVRGHVSRWLEERDDGWAAQRPAWSRPGWQARAGAWMQERMSAAGYQDLGPVELVQLWGLSVVLRCGSAQGPAFLKCSAEHFRHEAVLTRLLAARSADAVPEVLDLDAGEGWLLMRDLGGVECGTLPATQWAPGLAVHAGLQLAWQEHTAELAAAGAPLRPLGELATWVGELDQDDDLMGRLSMDERAAWDAAAPSLSDACLRLAEAGPSDTLVHGDLHPYNVSVGAGGVRIFDWTDAAVSHPFVDVVTYVNRTPDLTTRRALLDGYLAQWRGQLPATRLVHAGELALVAGSLYQLRTYRQLLPTLLPDDRGSMRDGDLQWLRRSLRRLDHGLGGGD